MRTSHRTLVPTAVLGTLVVLAVPLSESVGTQGAKPYSPPRLADGRPDLQGTYDLATLTPVERPAGMNATLAREEVAKLEKTVATVLALGARPISGDRAAPPAGGDGSRGAAGNVGGYNSFWLDPGSRYTMVNGEARTSIVVDPPDGRLPPMTPAARKRLLGLLGGVLTRGSAENDPGLDPTPGAYDDPERRGLGERCLLGFGSTAGPPALPNYFYNNLHKIVQTPNAVLILTEMVHDARVVRMNAEHLPKHIRKWMGDSVGHWEGDTLVVDTTNFNSDQYRYVVEASPGRSLMLVDSVSAREPDRLNGPSRDLHVIERFTRVADNALLYRFTVEDPGTWEKPWTGEYTWPSTDQPIYEYACHEANYALENVLRGARQRDAAAKK
jgi:hypothetical protein